MTKQIGPAPDPAGDILFVPMLYSEVNGFGATRKLYKYVTADTGKKILESGTMRWSTPAVLNDPFDMQFAFQLPTDMPAARAKIFERWYRRIVGDRINWVTDGIGIAALTASSWKPTTREEFELTKERVAAGREAAKRAGRRLGRKRKLDSRQIPAVRRDLAAGISPQEIARSFKVLRSTLYATLALQDQQAADQASIPVKRGRGRPKRTAIENQETAA